MSGRGRVQLFPFSDVVRDASGGNKKVPKGEYAEMGAFPVIDQGQDFIGGHTNDEECLVSGDGPWIVFGDHTRALKYVDFKFCMGADGVKVLEIKRPSACDAKYLFRFLQANEVPSAGYSRHFKFLKRLAIPLPPLDEQRRIAAILDKADSLRQKRKQAIALLDSLTQSIFLEMFGDPVSNPKALTKALLGDLIKVSSGNGLTAKNMDPTGVYPVYGGNGISGYHSNYMFEEPQLVIGRVGVYCGAIHLTEPRSWVTDNALYVREYKRPINVRYLESSLRLANLNQYAGRAAQPLISGSRIYPIEILLPAESEQNEYANRVDRLENLFARTRKATSTIDALFASLQHRAFAGELL